MVENSRAATGAGGLRRLNEPQPIAVDAGDDGLPRAMLWRGVYRPVRAIHDTWRIDDEWWREEIARRYFVVGLEGGRRLTLYRDLRTGAWYSQGYEDTSKAKGQQKATG